MKKAILIGLVLLVFGRAASGQHLGELSVNYSYMHYVPVDNLPSINLNGGGGAGVLYFAGFLGIKAEFQGYASQNVNFAFPPGSVRCPPGCTGTAEANLWTANVGPTVKIRIGRFQPFFEGLVGGAHTNFYQNVHNNCAGCVFASPGDWALDRHACKRLRQWLCAKHKVIGAGFNRFPEPSLHQVLGLVRLTARTGSFPWATS